jgi:peptidoglycan/xylan/chitin deacetylase (PgdA/CDA1 family)
MMNAGLDKPLRLLSSNSTLNIMYHGVVPVTNPTFSPRHISIQQFEQHLQYFSKNFQIISLKEAFDYYRNQVKPIKKTITVSFDDGYSNNLYYALPILEKYKIQSTFFISGVCVEQMEIRTLWADIIACLNYFHKDQVIEIGNFKFSNAIEVSSSVKLSDYIKSLMPQHRDDTLQMLLKKYNLKDKLRKIPGEYWELMNKDEIRELNASVLADIGSHGYLHYNLGIIEKQDAASELKKSRDLLENVCDKKIDMIAYPDGSYTAAVKDLAEELGYDKQLAVNYRLQDDLTDQRILNRHGISPNTTFESNMVFLNKAFHSQGYN